MMVSSTESSVTARKRLVFDDMPIYERLQMNLVCILHKLFYSHLGDEKRLLYMLHAVPTAGHCGFVVSVELSIVFVRDFTGLLTRERYNTRVSRMPSLSNTSTCYKTDKNADLFQ